MNTKEELQNYAIKMINRGDTYSSIHNYLKRNCDNEVWIKEIISEIDKLEKEGKVGVKKATKTNSFGLGKIFGIIFMAAGLFLVSFTWGKGVISTVPFIVIGVGILAFTGAIK